MDINVILDTYINDPKEALVSSFELPLVSRVFLMTLVVFVCSASTVMTAKGSGSLKTSRFDRPSAATTTRLNSVSAQVPQRIDLACDA